MQFALVLHLQSILLTTQSSKTLYQYSTPTVTSMRLKDVKCYVKLSCILNLVFSHIRQNYKTFELEVQKMLLTLCGTRKSINDVLICTDQMNCPFVFGISHLNFSAHVMLNVNIT